MQVAGNCASTPSSSRSFTSNTASSDFCGDLGALEITAVDSALLFNKFSKCSTKSSTVGCFSTIVLLRFGRFNLLARMLRTAIEARESRPRDRKDVPAVRYSAASAGKTLRIAERTRLCIALCLVG